MPNPAACTSRCSTIPTASRRISGSHDIGLVVGQAGGEIFNEEHTDPARVVVFKYDDFPATISRDDGMEAGFKEAVPDANFLGRYEGFNEETSYDLDPAAHRQQNPFNVILSITDVGAYGAIKALEEANFDPSSVIIVSANGESYAQELIRDGEFLRGTVALNREESSQIAIDAAVKMLAGSTVPETISYPPGDILTREVLQARDG